MLKLHIDLSGWRFIERVTAHGKGRVQGNVIWACGALFLPRRL
jgi:hypothetical protein